MPDVRWVMSECEEEAAVRLAQETMLSLVVARLLVARGVTTPEDAKAFLEPSLDSLHDPYLLPDMEPAVERLKRALENHEKILIHGDYDVDGVTGTALLVRVLRALGADVIYRLPHRKTEGYDIKPATVEEAREAGVSIIITCDCGTSAYSAAEAAEAAHIDLIITDHHEVGQNLPQVIAVVNPKRPDSEYPFPHLAGVGVALKLMDALVGALGHHRRRFLDKFIDLVALGTVGDVCSLTGENRVLVKFGLQALSRTKKKGLQALLRRCRLLGKDLVTYHLSHIMGPRINAVGRLDTAQIALDLLLTTDDDEADRLSEVLDQRNAERQAEQAKILEEALERIRGLDLETQKVLVLSAPGWNTGVVGIVASKVVDQYRRPAILLSQDPESGACAGSARSIEQFNLIGALRDCDDFLVRYGGHEHAAGLSLTLENLQPFAARLNKLADEVIRPEDMIPSIAVDAILGPDELSSDLAREIAAMEPFGRGNSEPVFVTSSLEVVQIQRMGADRSHLKMRVRGNGGSPTDCVMFGGGDWNDVLSVGREVDICYNIKINRFNGYESLQLVGKDLKEREAGGGLGITPATDPEEVTGAS